MNTGEFQELVGSARADPDFERIQLSHREPNIFRALAISRQEIRHSNFLAYLFDPQENQGLREIVLRKFLRDIFADTRTAGGTLFDADKGLRGEYKSEVASHRDAASTAHYGVV